MSVSDNFPTYFYIYMIRIVLLYFAYLFVEACKFYQLLPFNRRELHKNNSRRYCSWTNEGLSLKSAVEECMSLVVRVLNVHISGLKNSVQNVVLKFLLIVQ